MAPRLTVRMLEAMYSATLAMIAGPPNVTNPDLDRAADWLAFQLEKHNNPLAYLAGTVTLHMENDP